MFDWSYSYNSKGNLTWRGDANTDMNESFTYDTQNRLTDWKIYHSDTFLQSNTIAYDDLGNINYKSDLGDYTLSYGANAKPHALTGIDGVPVPIAIGIPAENLAVTYTDFKKIKTLNEGNKFYELTYGVDEQRRKSVYKENGANKETRYYLGNYEEKTDHTTGITEKIHYLSGAIYIVRSNGDNRFYFAYTDNIGSLTTLTDYNGNVVERYAYDPWGKRRNPNNWTQPDSRTHWLTNRGYTGHEMLDAFCIINMNGRVYDPLTAQFFSPDPFVSYPGDWLNYNRYTYAMNNPFAFTDPDGEHPLLIAALIGAAISAAGYTAQVAMSDGGFNNWNWGQFF